MSFEREIEDSLLYLRSNQALQCLAQDPYWPKWDSPWWHMLLLHEMGEVKRIPECAIASFVESLNRYPVKIFPIHPDELPDDVDPYRGTPCHCQLGNVYQVLFAWGVDVDSELPWIRPWFLRYQMADGGLNCDNESYLIKDEVPSSMVGTIAAFEAILLCTPRPWSKLEEEFLEKGAQFLIHRQLRNGSETKHNQAEQKSAQQWTKLCFPRYYFYDVLRGLSALAQWSQETNRTISSKAVSAVILDLQRRFPDGQVRIERRAFDDVGTLVQSPTGEWIRKQPASRFPLLNKISQVGETSPFLSRQWEKVRAINLLNSSLL